MPNRTTAPSTGPLVGLFSKAQGVAVLALALAALLGYGATLEGYFQGDDFGFVGRYHGYSFSEWPKLFVHGWADGLWSSSFNELRPLNALAFMIDAGLWDLNPTGYRCTNLLLHVLCAMLVGLTAWRVTRQRWNAVVAALCFTLHPVNAHAVAWITGRVDILATLFILAAFHAFLRYRQDASLGSVAILALAQAGALFTKESGVTLPLLLATADLCWLRPSPGSRDRRTWAPYAVCGTALAFYFGFRWLAFGNGLPGGIGRGFPSLVEGSTYLDLLRRETAFVTHLLPPLQTWLAAWRAADFALSSGVALKSAALLLGIGGATVLARRWLSREAAWEQRRPVVFFAFGWFVVATVPLMLTYYSARHLYLASAGFSIAIGVVLHGALPAVRPRNWVAAAAGLLLLTQLWQTLRPWRQGSALSRTITREATAAAETLGPGSAFFIDVPAMVDGAFCWSWALPHALRPPFTTTDLSARAPLLEPPATYAYSARWHRPPLFTSLRATQRESLLLTVTSSGDVQRTTIPVARVRTAAVDLAAESRLDDTTRWERFMAEIRSP